MINKMKCMLSRLSAQFLKATLALLAAYIVGGAWAWTDIDWTGNSESTVKYWDDTANWNNYDTSITSDGAWRILKSASITFRGNDGPSLQTWIAGGVGDNRAVFSATEDSYGFDLKDGWFCVGTWNDGELTISNGTHQVAWDLHVGYAAGWDASCTGIFTLKGGTFRTGYWLGVGEAKTGYTSTGKIFVEDGSLVVGYRNGALASGDARLNVGVSANSTGVIVQTGGTVSSSADGTGNAGDSAMVIGVEASSSGIYTISNGTYTARSGKVQIAVGTGSTGTLNVHGGVFSTSAIESGAGTATISLAGGTLSASAGGTFISSGITMTVGSNGGTIDVGMNNVTIAATVTGTGTIIKKGSGTLTFTGNMSGFTGSIINAEGDVVMLPAGAAAAAGVGTSKTDDGSNAIFASTAYAWTGAANDGGNWATPGNWAIAGVACTEIYPNNADAVVFFPFAATVVGSSSVRTGKVTIFDNVTLTGNFIVDAISGDDTVSLTLDTITMGFGEDGVFNVPVVAVNTVVNSSNKVLTFNKSVSGNGTISNSATGGSAWSGFAFNGDVSKYTGQYSGATRAEYTRDCTKLYSTAGASAKWTIGHSNGTSSLAEDGEYHFGQLIANVFTLKNRSNTTLYIGELEGADDSILNISERQYGTGNKVIKEGDATLNLSGAIGELEIKAGTVLLADSTAVPASVVLSGNGVLGFADDFTSAASFISVHSAFVAAVDVRQGKTVILADNFSGATGFTKHGSGILELTVMPAWTGTTSVNGGVLILPANSEVSLDAETSGSIVLSDNRIMCYSRSEVNVWTGGDSGTWSDGNNWSKNVAPSSDNEIVYIPSAANSLTITCTGGDGDHTGILTILRDVTFEASNSGITLNTIGGTGTLTIQSKSNNNIFNLYSAGDYTINTDVCMNNKVYNNNQSNLKIYGDFSGNGTITMYSQNGQAGFRFYGNTAGFKGSYTGCSRANWSRDGTRFYGTESIGSEDASWQFSYEGTQGGEKASPLNVNNTIYKFGQLTSDNFRFKPTTGSIVEAGNKANLTSTVSGTLYDNSNIFRKVGATSTCDLTLTESKGTVEIKEGLLNLAGMLPNEIKFTGGTLKTALDPSACIASSTSAIVFDDSGETYEWASAIANSNTGGFTKKGSGTLTLSQPPAYTGTTTVEAGLLVMPASAEETFTLGANTIVSARDANTITLANATTVNVTGLTHEHATATVTAGGESVTVAEGVAAVPVGSNVVITWTAASGYQIDAGGTQEISNIREAVAATAPTVSELPTVTIAAPTVGEYGNDFATVTVTAGVTSTYPAATTITYTLKANGTAIATTTAAGDATSVTFNNANVSSLTRYGNISYTVEASGDNVTAATSDATTAMFADTIGWVNENYETTTTAAAGGAWQTAVTYDSETHKAAVVDNRFSATNCTTGDVVTVTIDDVVYTSLSDLTSADTDAQGAVAVGGTEESPKFMLLTKQNDTVGWYEAAGVTPVLETGVYDIVMTFNYNSNTYTVTVNDTPLTVDSVAAVPLAKAQTSVKDIDFLGAGSIAAINGVQYEGKMAIDQDGVKYATVEAALQANANVKGAVIKLLHGSATTSAEGWNFDSETKTFVKKVIGLIFLAF